MTVAVLLAGLAGAGGSEAQVCVCEGYHGGYFLTDRQGNEEAFLRLFQHLERSPRARVALELEPYTLERMVTGAVSATEKRSATPRVAIWHLWDQAPAGYEWGEASAHSGKRGLCVTLRDSPAGNAHPSRENADPSGPCWANVSQAVGEHVPRGELLVFSAFVKTNASGSRLYIDAHSNGDIIPGSVASTGPAPPTGQWERVELRWHVPLSAKTLFPTLTMNGKAGDTFWFDDISLRVAESGQELLRNGSFEEEEVTRFESPEILARLQDGIRKGQVEVVGGAYTQPLWSAHDGEGWVRQFLLGSETVRRALGVDVRTYACQEGGFISQLPQILTAFGFTGCLFRVHWAPWGEMPSFDDDGILWEGPDGSRIICVPRYALDEARGFGWPMTPVEQVLSKALQAGIERPLVTGFADFLPTEVPYYDPAAFEAQRLPCWAALGQEIRAEPLRGRTLIFSGYVRSTAYRAFLIIDTGDVAFVPPGIALGKPDGEWHHVEVAFKVPPEAEVLHPHVKVEGARGEACFGGLSLEVAGEGDDLLRDGSFEVGDRQPEEWSLWRRPNTSAEVQWGEPAPGGGSRSVRLRFEGPQFPLEAVTIGEYLKTMRQPTRVIHDPWDGFQYRWPWGILGGELQQRCREAQRLTEAAERAAARTGVPASAQAQIGNAWRLVLMANHHDTQSCFPGKFGAWRGPEGDYADLCGAWTDEATKAATEVLRDLFPPSRGNKRVLTALNPLPVPRQVVLEWVLDGKSADPRSSAVRTAGGALLPSETLVLPSRLDGNQRETVVTWRAALPPLAAETFELTDREGAAVPGTLAAVESASLENEHYRLRLTQDQGLVGLFDKSQNREVLSAPAGYAGSFPEQEDEVHSAATRLRTHAGELLSVAEVTGRLGSVPYEERILLRQGSPFVEVETTFDFGAGTRIGSQRNDVFPGTGWNSDWVDEARKLRFVLPAALPVERAWCDQAYDVRRAPRSPFWALSWAAGEGADGGIAVLLDRSSGFLWGKQGLQLVLAYGGRFMFGPSEGIPLTGKQRFRFAIYSYAGDWEQATVPALAEEFSTPVVLVGGEGAVGSLLQLEPPGRLLLGAVYSKGSALIVRLYNPYTRVHSALLAVAGLKRAWEADLRGQPTRTMPVTENRVAVSVAPKRLLTLRIQRNALPAHSGRGAGPSRQTSHGSIAMTSGGVLLSAIMLGSLTLASWAAAEERILPQASKPDGSPNRAVWMARGGYGMMTHYLIQPQGATPEERTADLNRIVDRFDLDYFIGQVKTSGAGWLIFTLGQTTGYLCSPNAYLDARAPGLTPHRDILLEIAQRLKRLGKRLILYLPSEGQADPVIQAALGSGTDGYTGRYLNFLRTYSLKLGKLHHGWWFDGCAPHPEAYWQEWLAAVRAGNPEAVVAFSGAEFCGGGPIDPVCKLEDYHAGEIHLLEDGKIRRDFLPPGGDIVVTAERKLRLRGQEARLYMPDGPFLDGVQWHCLLPLDLTFNPAVPNQFCHYTDKELLQFVRDVKRVGGAITINVPIEVDTGHIPEDSHAALVRLGRNLRGLGGQPG